MPPHPARTHSRVIPTLAAAAALLIALAQLGAPEPGAPGLAFETWVYAQSQPAAPTLHVYSRETIVDVLVTDDQGNPVRGLTQSNFTVQEDGQPQPIRSFYEYDTNTPPTPAPTLPPDTYTNARTLPAKGPVQIFLFDLLGSAPADIERSKKYIADYLRTMPAGTQVVLFAFSPSKDLVLLHDFTTDGPAAAAAVNNLNDEWTREPVVATPIAIAGMNQIADYVASIQGRKNLVWIVPGMPLLILRDGGLSWAIGAPPDMTIVHRLMDLYDRFNLEQIAIYPLDPRGVHGLGFATLKAQAVADATGGTLDDTNDYKGELTKVVDQSSHLYTLSYVPPRADTDGHYHPITIAVDRPGLHVVYRGGYNDEQPNPPAPALIHDMIQGPMRLGAIPSTQLLFDLHVQPASASSSSASAASPIPTTPSPHTKGAPYDALFLFDPKQIALTQNPDGTRTASIEVDLGAYDSFGQLVAARSQAFKLTITPAQYPGFLRGPLKFPLAIDLPHGQLNLRAGLFDTVANKSGTLQIPLAVPKK
jgi:VWFA-related protein